MKQVLLMIVAMALLRCGEKRAQKPPAKAEATPKTERKADATPKPGMPFTNTLGMKFVPIPGTEVQFCIWETRVKDYAAYAATNSGVGAIWKNSFRSFKQEDTHPVLKVNWNDARAFCAWLTKKELAVGKLKAGMRYRLPTDAEWSTAVGLGKEKGNTPDEKQRGIKDVYPWGKGYPPPKEAGNYYKSLKVVNFDYTSPVGSFAANKFGLYDMGGNVFEWCEDKMTSGRELSVCCEVHPGLRKSILVNYYRPTV